MREKYTVLNKQIRINIENTKIQDTISTENKQTSFRYYKHEKLGILCVSGDYDNEEEIFNTLLQSSDKWRDYPILQQMNRQENLITDFCDINQKELVELLERTIQRLTNDFPEYSLSGEFVLDRQEISMKNENTLYLHFEDQLLIGKMTLHKHDDKADEVYFDMLFRNFTAEKIYEEMAQYIRAFDHVLEPPHEEKITVIFSTGNPTPMKKLEKDLQPDMMVNGISQLSGTLDRLYFNENFTLYTSLDPYSSKVNSWEILPFFDLEGTINPGYKKILIEDGVIRSPYTCKQTSEKYEFASTGSAHGSLDSYPYAAPIGFVVGNSTKNLNTLLDGRQAIYLSEIQNDPFDDRGSFCLDTHSAFLCEGGKITGRYPSLNVYSDSISMFREGFVGVSCDHLFGSDINRAMVLEMNIRR